MTHDLESDSMELRKAAVERVLREKSLSVKEVRSIAEKHVAGLHKHGTAKDAILLLGKLRAVDEIPWLVSHLTFEVFYKETKRPQPPEDVFPVAQALIDIGQPSIKPVLDRVKAGGDPKVYLAAATVLRGVLGDQKALETVDREIALSNRESERAALRALASRLRNGAKSG